MKRTKSLIILIAISLTTGMAFAQSNNANIDQVGDDHEATITQAGSLNGAFVKQTADAGRYGNDVGTASVEQTGSSNSVNLRQRAFYGDAQATIVQLGDGNRVEGIAPGQDFLQNHGLNIVDVYMEGNSNALYSLQPEAQKNVNTFLLNINGNTNEVGLFQHFGYGEVDIIGNDNNVLLSQKSNASSTEQTAFVDILGTANVVDINQTGNSHTSTVNITGDSNTSMITQSN